MQQTCLKFLMLHVAFWEYSATHQNPASVVGKHQLIPTRMAQLVFLYKGPDVIEHGHRIMIHRIGLTGPYDLNRHIRIVDHVQEALFVSRIRLARLWEADLLAHTMVSTSGRKIFPVWLATTSKLQIFISLDLADLVLVTLLKGLFHFTICLILFLLCIGNGDDRASVTDMRPHIVETSPCS